MEIVALVLGKTPLAMLYLLIQLQLEHKPNSILLKATTLQPQTLLSCPRNVLNAVKV